jgi:lysophospholipase L1-like esterase
MTPHRLSGLRRRWLALLAVLAFGIAAWAAPAVARADSYVSLGDSYTSGPLIPNQIGPPFGCLRSDRNYPHLAAPSIGFPLRDPSCGGARTDHMTQPQNVQPDGPNAPQFDSLDAATNVVSITIGGNDIGFSEIVESCTSATPFGSPCQDRYNSGGVDRIHERIVATAPKVAAVLQGIHARSPSARVFVLNYAAVFPETGNGCWPQMPVARADVPYLRAKQKELNQMLADQAAANGATYVDAYTAGIGHDACQPPGIRWVEPAVFIPLAAPVHPNIQGMQGVANEVVAALS